MTTTEKILLAFTIGLIVGAIGSSVARIAGIEHRKHLQDKQEWRITMPLPALLDTLEAFEHREHGNRMLIDSAKIEIIIKKASEDK